MSDPTDRDQPDEALRRARAAQEAGTRDLLLRIADRLSGNRPSVAMGESNRLALALSYATHVHGDGTPAANAAERMLLRHMPRVNNRAITRSEYAYLLRAAAGRVVGQAERVAELQAQAATDLVCAKDPKQQAAARNQLNSARDHAADGLH